ncbi:hypothetical protein FJT64_025853 [Amphibalanus amphitrite]|uniref:Uncharacterized protein n=1 Tax=Amphibalanus amphitrite TaxID=1232801 RepID=A0A6A4WIT2_AMPAM|nr:hypothetical protein FJT64_025853 [Amphibalanus amphitrite]
MFHDRFEGSVTGPASAAPRLPRSRTGRSRSGAARAAAMGLTARQLVAHLVRLMARRRRLIACWLLLLPLLSLALLPTVPDRRWPPQRAASCGRPLLAGRPDVDAERLWPQLRAAEVSGR